MGRENDNRQYQIGFSLYLSLLNRHNKMDTYIVKTIWFLVEHWRKFLLKLKDICCTYLWNQRRSLLTVSKTSRIVVFFTYLYNEFDMTIINVTIQTFILCLFIDFLCSFLLTRCHTFLSLLMSIVLYREIFRTLE